MGIKCRKRRPYAVDQVREPAERYDASGDERRGAGYLMIKEISINNFRGFRKVNVDGLSRVNVLLGPNGSGKTALLEAIFLASGGSPELGLRLRNFRGMGTSLDVRADGLEGMWRNLFHRFDLRKSIDIGLQSTDMQSRSLTISRGSSEELRLPLKARGARSVTAPIEFAWKDARGSIFRSRPVVSGDKLSFPQSSGAGSKVVFLPAQFRISPDETARRFSAISRRDAVKDLLAVLTGVYDEIEDASVENSDGSWEVFLKLRDLDERIPIGLHSSGVSRLVTILLAITAAQNGTVLIDEIENGFYFKTLEGIWRSILAVADEFKCQVFASTHSNECIASLKAIVGDQPDSFSLLNLERSEGSSRVVVSPGEVMAAALQSGFDLR